MGLGCVPHDTDQDWLESNGEQRRVSSTRRAFGKWRRSGHDCQLEDGVFARRVSTTAGYYGGVVGASGGENEVAARQLGRTRKFTARRDSVLCGSQAMHEDESGLCLVKCIWGSISITITVTSLASSDVSTTSKDDRRIDGY